MFCHVRGGEHVSTCILTAQISPFRRDDSGSKYATMTRSLALQPLLPSTSRSATRAGVCRLGTKIMRVLITSRTAYDFEDRTERRRVTGNAISYVTGQRKVDDNGQWLETAVIKGNTEEVMLSVVHVPGIYEIEQTVDVKKNGQATLKIASARFICPVDMPQLLELAATGPLDPAKAGAQ